MALEMLFFSRAQKPRKMSKVAEKNCNTFPPFFLTLIFSVEVEIEVDVEEEKVENGGENDGNEGEIDGEPQEATEEAAAAVASEETKGGALEGEGAGGAPGEPNPEQVEGEVVPEVPAAPKKTIIKKKQIETIEKFTLFMSLDKMTMEMNELTTVFFIRCTDGEVPKISDCENPSALNEHFEFSIFTGDVLYGIANIMQQVYYPVVQKGQVELAKPNVAVDDTLRHELGSNVAKFEQHLRHVVHQSHGDARLFIPNLSNPIHSPEAAARDLDIVGEIESALEDWTAVISREVEAELHKVGKRNRTPLGEIEFWRERNASLSALYEQINTHKVQQMLQVMKIIDNPQLSSFNYHFGELSKLYLEAKDNVKFLTTLERHFKHLHDGSFQTILDSMQSMVNGLRMVWVISRHYNTDERMAPLMETIAEMLAKRVRDEVGKVDLLLFFSSAHFFIAPFFL